MFFTVLKNGYLKNNIESLNKVITQQAQKVQAKKNREIKYFSVKLDFRQL